MSGYLIVKIIHVISSCILLGTGIGIAFFMFRSNSTENLNERFYAIKNTVLADYIFTLPAVLIQPVSGAWLVVNGGYDWTAPWLIGTYVLFVLIGLCWLPVVLIQIKLRNILKLSLRTNSGLPDEYSKLMRVWCLLGCPAFLSLLVIFYLMVVKPN